jgi:hypothetical protein
MSEEIAAFEKNIMDAIALLSGKFDNFSSKVVEVENNLTLKIDQL